jgi:hypothetical protein
MDKTIDMAREAGIIDFRDAFSEEHVQAVLQDLKTFESLVRADERAQPAACTWTKSNDPHMPDTFDSNCGVVWTFTDGGPVENDMHFCPKCGAAVSVAATAPEPEEDLFDLAMKADNGGQP